MQVPAIEAPSVEEQPLPGRAYPRFSEEVQGGAFGESLAAGVNRVSQAATEEQTRVKTQNDQLRVIDANSQLEAARDGLLYGRDGKSGVQNLRGKDAINLPQTFLPEYDKIAQGINDTLTPDQQRMFAPHVSTTRNALELGLNRYEFQQSQVLANEIYKNSSEQAINSAALNWRDPMALGKARLDLKGVVSIKAQHEGWGSIDDPTSIAGVELQNKMAQLHAGVIDAMLSDGQADKARAYFESNKGEFSGKEQLQVEKQIHGGEIQQTAAGILSAYQQSRESGAQALTGLEHSGLNAEDQMKVTALVARGREDLADMRQQSPSIRAQIDKLNDDIAGNTAGPQSLGLVDSLWEKGALTDNQRAVKRSEVLRSQRVGSQNTEDVAYVQDAYDKGTPLDPVSDRRKVNLFLAETTMGQAPGTPAFNNAAVAVAQRVQVVPDAVFDYARTQLSGGTDADAGRAAQLLASVQRAAPRAYAEQIDAKTKALTAMIAPAIEAGADPESVVEKARKVADLSPQDRKYLADRWNDVMGKEKGRLTENVNWIRAGLADDPHYTTPGRFWGRDSGSVPQVPATMAAEFNSLSRLYFDYTGGNMEQAHALALNDLKGTWGVTEVNGKRELMKYAPERMVPGLTADAIREKIASEGYGAARLTEYPGLTASTNGRLWGLSEPDQWGSWDAVMGGDGRPYRFELPQPDPNRLSFEHELEHYEDEERLRAKQERERFAVEHPIRQPGF